MTAMTDQPLRPLVPLVPLDPGVQRPLTRYAPVLALTIVREGSAGRELVCAVRRPETNATHPNVLSVPTVRDRAMLAASWPAQALDGDTVPGLSLLVELLLCRKLGAADALESGALTYELGRLGAWQGSSFIDVDTAGCDVTEDLTMFNAEVIVTGGGDLLPERTASYDPIRWTPVKTFFEVVATRDVSLVDARLDQVLVCVRGLCVETTRRMLQQP